MHIYYKTGNTKNVIREDYISFRNLEKAFDTVPRKKYGKC